MSNLKNDKCGIDLLIRKALVVRQKPTQQLNDSIIRQYDRKTIYKKN